MKNKKGFVFVETIVVISIIISSLLIILSDYTATTSMTNRRARYDDVTKLYEAYYLKKYFNSFNFSKLIENMENGAKYQQIYRGDYELFGTKSLDESAFFEKMWEDLKIRSIYLLPYDVTKYATCELTGIDAICADKNLTQYLKTLDVSGSSRYRLVVEFAMNNTGKSCGSRTECFYYFANIEV